MENNSSNARGLTQQLQITYTELGHLSDTQLTQCQAEFDGCITYPFDKTVTIVIKKNEELNYEVGQVLMDPNVKKQNSCSQPMHLHLWWITV